MSSRIRSAWVRALTASTTLGSARDLDFDDQQPAMSRVNQEIGSHPGHRRVALPHETQVSERTLNLIQDGGATYARVARDVKDPIRRRRKILRIGV